jgi:hypothetical protein
VKLAIQNLVLLVADDGKCQGKCRYTPICEAAIAAKIDDEATKPRFMIISLFSEMDGGTASLFNRCSARCLLRLFFPLAIRHEHIT